MRIDPETDHTEDCDCLSCSPANWAHDLTRRGITDDAADVIANAFTGRASVSTYSCKPGSLALLIEKLAAKGIAVVEYPHSLDLSPAFDVPEDFS